MCEHLGSKGLSLKSSVLMFESQHLLADLQSLSIDIRFKLPKQQFHEATLSC
jgi:hypothetical protein